METLFQTLCVTSQDIEMGFWIEKCAMQKMKRESAEGKQLSNQEWIRTLRVKEKYMYFEILEVDAIKQWEMKERISVPLMNRKASQNQGLWQKHHQRGKHLGSPSFKILETILKLDKGGAQINEQRFDVYAQGITSERGYKQTSCIKKIGRRRRTC